MFYHDECYHQLNFAFVGIKLYRTRIVIYYCRFRIFRKNWKITPGARKCSKIRQKLKNQSKLIFRTGIDRFFNSAIAHVIDFNDYCTWRPGQTVSTSRVVSWNFHLNFGTIDRDSSLGGFRGRLTQILQWKWTPKNLVPRVAGIHVISWNFPPIFIWIF